MSTPVIQVLVGFQTTTGFGNPFQLNDPVYGVLDTSTLGGLAFADLTSLVESVNISRGRNRQQGRQAWKCSARHIRGHLIGTDYRSQ